MKVFFDTNILVDLLVPVRPSADASSSVLDELVKNRHEIVVTTQSILDVYYIAQGYSVSKTEIDVLTAWLLNHTNVRPIDCFDLRMALEYLNPDYEDYSQLSRAEGERCSVFLTSDKNILARGMDTMLVLTPEQFVERMRAS